MPILRCISIMNHAISVTTPSPPIWISTRITAWPKVLQAVAVGSVTSPVTQAEVAAVNSASI